MFAVFSRLAGVILLSMGLLSAVSYAQEPDLPAGLGSFDRESEPSLPMGIGNDEPALPGGLQTDDEPSLPEGIVEPTTDVAWQSESDDGNDWGITGFWETRVGTRLKTPVAQDHTSLAETRLELEKEWFWNDWSSKATANVLYDDVEDSQHIDLENGRGWLDIREAWVHTRLGDTVDVKAGRQILTWGVGDLLFINDLFPKDWNSFLAGRDDQYLKAPSDALRVGVYHHWGNLNIVYTPRFDSDRYIDGRRLSYYSPMFGAAVGENALVITDKPTTTGTNDEIALRYYRQIVGFEAAAYFYDGYWKSPGGFDINTGLAIFPRLRVYGASLRGQWGAGIFSAEMGYYDSRDDSQGSDNFINNSEWRGLLGYEVEVATDTTLAAQYYLEVLQDYTHYQQALMPGQIARDEVRQVITTRLTRLAMNQNLTISFFAFYSPTDRDAYIKPSVSYKIDDHWTATAGANWFIGKDEHTFFGQFESNSNAFVALRYGF